MKIFSTLAVETGSDVLGRGILLNADDLTAFLADKMDKVLETGGMDGKTCLEKLAAMEGTVLVRVLFR